MLQRLANLPPGRMLLLALVVSELLTALLVCGFGLLFRGEITVDYLLTGAGTCLVVAVVVVASVQSLAARAKRAEERRDESEERHHMLFEHSRDAMYMFDPESLNVVEGNAAFWSLLGREPGALSLREFIGHEEASVREHTKRIVDRGFLDLKARQWRDVDGAVLDVEVTGHRVRLGGRHLVAIVARDITARLKANVERDKLREQLFTAQKLEAIGQLAGGIAHDFNNLMGGVLASTNYVRQLEPGAPSSDDIVSQVILDIEGAARRAAELTRQLMTFARRQPPVIEAVDVRGVVTEVTTLLRRTVDPAIQVVTDVPEGLAVRADAGHLHQVIMNLAINARDAMPDGGELRISAVKRASDNGTDDNGTDDNGTDDNGAEDNGTDDASDGLVELAVSDNGSGMDAETLSRVFEPFFTSKGPQSGTGLGLAVVYGIVVEHGGQIHVDSEPGVGTTVRIALPSAEFEARTRPDSGPTPMGEGRILVIDDDDMLRRPVARILGSLGYTAVLAADGKRGLALFEEANGGFDAVLLDMLMPEMDGAQVFEALVVLDASVVVVVMSGYVEQDRIQRVLDAGAAGSLAKPFSRVALALALSDALQANTDRSETAESVAQA